jgi:hypothetical protein
MPPFRRDDDPTACRSVARGAIAFLLLTLACGNGTAPQCTGPVTVRTTMSATPIITWTPDCGVARLTIAAPPSLGVVHIAWSISSPGSEIESGVRYGRVPNGATESSPAIPLGSGAQLGILLEAPIGSTVGTAPLTVP